MFVTWLLHTKASDCHLSLTWWSCAWHDSFIHESYRHTWVTTRMCVTWLIRIWVITDIRWIMTRINVHVRDVTPSYRSIRLPSQPHLMVHVCDMTHSYMCQCRHTWGDIMHQRSNLFIFVHICSYLFIVVCYMTPSYKSHCRHTWVMTRMSVMTCVTWLIHTCVITDIQEPLQTYISHDTHQHSYLFICVRICSYLFIFVCYMTHSYMCQCRHTSVMTRINIHICSYVCVTWLIHIWVFTDNRLNHDTHQRSYLFICVCHMTHSCMSLSRHKMSHDTHQRSCS